MKMTRTLILAGAAMCVMLLGGCADDGPYYGGGYYSQDYSGPYSGDYGPYYGGVYRRGGYSGAHHFYGNSFGHSAGVSHASFHSVGGGRGSSGGRRH